MGWGRQVSDNFAGEPWLSAASSYSSATAETMVGGGGVGGGMPGNGNGVGVGMGADVGGVGAYHDPSWAGVVRMGGANLPRVP